jgi:hypothetical protein
MITLKSTPLYLIALLILGINSTHAQEQTTETNSLKPGAWALQFGISNNFTLSSFQGATISAKYQSSATNAWRAGVTINASSGNNTSLQSPIQDDTISNLSSSNGSSTTESVSLKVQYIWYVNMEGMTHFYTGVGPLIAYNHYYNNQQSSGSSNYSSNNEWNIQNSSTTSNSWSVGASAAAGVEYFPVHVFSLHAEYGASLAYQQQKAEATSRSANNYSNYSNAISTGTNTSSSSHGWALNNANLSFGLSVYF